MKITISNKNTTLANPLLTILGLAGATGLVFSQVGIMVNHPLTKTIHSLLHIVGSGSGLFLLIGLSGFIAGYFTRPSITRLYLWGAVGLILFVIGVLLYIAGTFNYAILHGLLNLIGTDDPVHRVPLTLAPLVMCVGSFLLGLVSLREKVLSRPLAIFLMISAFIYALGWLVVGDSMQRQLRNSRYLEALLIVLPFGVAWCWVGIEQFRKKSHIKPPEIV